MFDAYRFQILTPDDYEYALDDDDEYDRLVKVDRVLLLDEYQHIKPGIIKQWTVNRLDDALQRAEAKSKVKPRSPSRRAPAMARTRFLMPKLSMLDPMRPRFKAQLWHEGHAVHLGYFNSQEARDAAVRDAKFRRSIGLPIKP